MNNLRNISSPPQPLFDGMVRAFLRVMTNSDEWKVLFEQVANETDPQKLSKLLDRLIQALDERRKALRGMQANKPTANAGEAET